MHYAWYPCYSWFLFPRILPIRKTYPWYPCYSWFPTWLLIKQTTACLAFSPLEKPIRVIHVIHGSYSLAFFPLEKCIRGIRVIRGSLPVLLSIRVIRGSLPVLLCCLCQLLLAQSLLNRSQHAG